MMTTRSETVSFLQGLKETGYVEGQNVAVEYRYAENQFDRLPALAADFVRRRTAVIASSTIPLRRWRQRQRRRPCRSSSSSAGDPVALGLVAGLNRPGANVTGHCQFSGRAGAETIAIAPRVDAQCCPVRRCCGPGNSSHPIHHRESCTRRRARWACNLSWLMPEPIAISKRPLQLFRNSASLRFWSTSSSMYNRRMDQLAALAARHALPAIYPFREYALAGGLTSYGSSIGYLYRQVGIYAGRILKGDKPADLPVQQVTKIELVINLKTADALGITFPQTLLASRRRGDRITPHAGFGSNSVLGSASRDAKSYRRNFRPGGQTRYPWSR